MPEFGDVKSKKYFLQSFLGWKGVLFVKEGAYKKGIFKFIIQIPSSYPSKAPTVTFETKVIHPLINSKTAILDIRVRNFLKKLM